MCCCEAPAQRESRTMTEWWLMKQSIKEVQLYVYLGIILAVDIDFTQHTKVTGWMRQSYHFQYRWIYGMSLLKRYECIGFYPLDRQFLSAGETHILP
jgi:hypothetical protein